MLDLLIEKYNVLSCRDIKIIVILKCTMSMTNQSRTSAMLIFVDNSRTLIHKLHDLFKHMNECEALIIDICNEINFP